MPKLKKPLTPDQRIESRKEIIEQLDSGELKLGQAIRKMRLEWTGLSQCRFGKIVGLSANTISAVERDADNTTVKTLNQILRRLGMRSTVCSTVARG